MARDRLAEIAAVRARGQGRGWSRGLTEIEVLESEWQGGTGPLRIAPQFIAIRLVTILEVFTRDWLAMIIDAGEPYISRAAELVRGALKIDFALAQALVGKQVTFGELVSHEVSVNGIGDISDAFSKLLDEPLFTHLEKVVDRWAIKINEKPPAPILSDPQWACSQLAKLFETRHVLVHELPDDRSFGIDNAIVDYVRAASEFVNAADQAFSTLLHGDYPLTQVDINADAHEKATQADDELRAVLAKLDPLGANELLVSGQATWQEYRRLHAEYRSGITEVGHGSMAPMLYSSEIEAITRARIEQLEWYLNREEGDM